MISHEDIKNLVSEWQLREDIIEKDYVIGWVLWGIGTDPAINHKWIFKGGTCLKKCYNAPFLTRGSLSGSGTTSIYQPSRIKTKKYKSSHDYPYTIECSFCGKKFKRKYYDTKLNPHKDKNGFNCPGKIGFIV